MVIEVISILEPIDLPENHIPKDSLVKSNTIFIIYLEICLKNRLYLNFKHEKFNELLTKLCSKKIERMSSLEIPNIKYCNKQEELKKFMLYSLPQEFKVLFFNIYNCVQTEFPESQCPKVPISDFFFPLCVVLPKVTDSIIIHSATGGKVCV